MTFVVPTWYVCSETAEQWKLKPVSMNSASPLSTSALSCFSVVTLVLIAPSTKPECVKTTSQTCQATLKSPPVEAIPTRWSCPLTGEQDAPPLKSVHAWSEPGKTP